MTKVKIMIFFFLFLFSHFSFADVFKVTLTGYNISIKGEKEKEMQKVLSSFPLKEKDVFEIIKKIDKDFIIKKEFEVSFDIKDNVLTIVEPVLEWGKLHLEIKITPMLINDVIVEFNVEEYPKEWEEKMKKFSEKKIPDEIIEENRKKTKEEILKKAKEENWSQEWLQGVLEDMEKNYNLLKGFIGPKTKIKGGKMQFKLGWMDILYNNRINKEIKDRETITFSDFRTILIERR
ncbi:MAG: hypothetical protein ACPLZ9_01525 [Candidatus Ratteibacteria bacterium]